MAKRVGCTRILKQAGFGPLNMLSFVGAVVLAIGFAIIVYNVYYSTRYASRNIGSDPWNARTLEWATQTPVQSYNFALTPQVESSEAYWDHKKKGKPYSKAKLKRFICRITAVYRLS